MNCQFINSLVANLVFVVSILFQSNHDLLLGYEIFVKIQNSALEIHETMWWAAQKKKTIHNQIHKLRHKNQSFR